MIKLGVSYFGNRFLGHAREDLKRIAGSCDYVVHTMDEADLNYHKFVLGRIMEESKKAGLEVWVDPWGLGGVFGGETLSKFLADHRQSWQVMSDGRHVPLACLNRPEWRSYVKEWILTVRDMGADVLFWDEPHVAFDFQSELAGIFSCLCPECKSLYKKKYGVEMPKKLNVTTQEFRRETIKGFLTDIFSFSKSKGFKNALCLYAFKGNHAYDALWREAAALPNLDIFGCDPYWRWHGNHDPAVHVRDFSRVVAESCRLNKLQSQIWIQAMRLPAGAEIEIAQACGAAAREGINYLAAWSFDGGELLDPILSERPEDVWRAVEETFTKIRLNR